MALPLLPLPSSLALEDDDELQESTAGLSKVLSQLRGKNKRVSPAEKQPADYDWAAEWEVAAENAGICALPDVLGGRRLCFRRRKNTDPKMKRYELFFGTCDGLVVCVSLYASTKFRAAIYDMEDFQDNGTDVLLVTLLFSGGVGKGGVWNYTKGGTRPDNVEEEVWKEWHEFVKGAMVTIVDSVDLDMRRKAPNGFETAFDVNPKQRTLAAFLRGKYV